jgi:hypothetical protein
MAVDHTRALPVESARLDHLSKRFFSGGPEHLDEKERRELVVIAMLGELVEEQQRTNFFLQEAYEIYNGRFR